MGEKEGGDPDSMGIKTGDKEKTPETTKESGLIYIPTPEEIPGKESKEKKEHIPTPEEVRSIFEILLNGRQFETARRKEDEKGVCLWTIEIKNKNGRGHIEYEYMRKAKNPHSNFPVIPYIYKASYDETGFPTTGESSAKYIDGKWKVTP